MAAAGLSWLVLTLSSRSKLEVLSRYTGKQQHYYVIILGGLLNERATRGRVAWVTDLGFQVAIFSVQHIWTVLIIFYQITDNVGSVLYFVY